MDAAPPGPPTTARKPRAKRTSRKLPDQQVQQLAQQGLNSVQIGKIVDCHPSTIRRFLDKIQPEYQALKDFRSGRSDALATLQAKNLSLQDKLIDLLHEERLLNTLAPQQISGLLFALNTQHGTLYDKERIETGQSTQNVSVISTIINSAVRDIYKPLRTKGSSGSAPQEGAGGLEVSEQAADPAADSQGGGTPGYGGKVESDNGNDSPAVSS